MNKAILQNTDFYNQSKLFFDFPENVSVKKENSLFFLCKNSYNPIKAEAHTAPYKIHKYFARRPWNVFKQIIEKYSNSQDIILDPFCGGGVTIYEGLRLNRKVIGFDINPLSNFVIRNMIKKPVKILELNKALQEIRKYLENLYGSFYQFTDNSNIIDIEWCELTFEVECNLCGTVNILKNENKIKNGFYKCSNSECQSHKSKNLGYATKDCKRIGHKYLECIGNYKSNRKSIKFTNEIEIQLHEHLQFLKQEIINNNISIPDEIIPTDWDRQFEDGLLQKGITKFKDLFTERNLLINLLLLDFIKKYENKIEYDNYELLRIIFSNVVKETNIMSFTNDGWQAGKPTTWSKHAYWIPNQFCEVNILSIFDNAVEKIKSSLSFNAQQNYNVKKATNFDDLKENNFLLVNNSIANYEIPDNSVDAIITDPPYGSNVQYLELSHFWYIWNKDLYSENPNFKEEAVANRKKNFNGSKSMYDYEELLFKVYKKTYQVLKPNKFMVLTFNNKDVSAWLALLFSIFKSGFTLHENGLFFQDGVENYKQTAHTKFDGSPYGDFIYVFVKKENTNIKIYENESQFITDLDKTLKSFMQNKTDDKNTVIKNMFLNSIPIIESFAKSYLINNKHNLYSIFKKDYLEKLY